MNDMNENAKVDWMNLVKKHRKRQKGLPALSTLNTNAGNVEHNVEMFNKMSTTGDLPTMASVSAEGLGEAWKNTLGDVYTTNDDTVILHYYELPVQTQQGWSYYYDATRGGIEQTGGDETEITIDYEYEIEKSELAEWFENNVEVRAYLGNPVNDNIFEIIDQKFEDLIKHFAESILKSFKSSAIEHAETYDDIPLNEAIVLTSYTDCDDTFDMSMRSVL